MPAFKKKLSLLLDEHTLFRQFYRMNFVKVREASLIWHSLSPKENELICDVGCGDGICDYEMAKKGVDAVGLDMTQSRISYARSLAKNASVTFIVGSAEDLPFRESSFDKMICVSAIEHIEDDEAVLNEMNRVLRGNGTLIITTDAFKYPSSRTRKYLEEQHHSKYKVKKCFSAEELTIKLKKSGFKVQESRYFCNSWMSAFFLNLGIRTNLGLPFMFLFPIALPLASISDKLFAWRNGGYFLIVKAVKVGDDFANY